MYPVEREGPASIARLEGQYSSLDDEVMDEARAALLQLADECEPPYLVLDVSAVEYVSSMFIEMLFRCHTRLKRRGGTLAFCSPGDFLHSVLHVTRLDTIFAIFPTRAEAVAYLIERAARESIAEAK